MADFASIILSTSGQRARAIEGWGAARRARAQRQDESIARLGAALGNYGSLVRQKQEEDELRDLNDAFTGAMVQFGGDEDGGIAKALEAARSIRPRTKAGSTQLAKYLIDGQSIAIRRQAAQQAAAVEKMKQQQAAMESVFGTYRDRANVRLKRDAMNAATERENAKTAAQERKDAEEAARRQSEEFSVQQFFAPVRPAVDLPIMAGGSLPGIPSQVTVPAQMPTAQDYAMRAGLPGLPTGLRQTALAGAIRPEPRPAAEPRGLTIEDRIRLEQEKARLRPPPAEPRPQSFRMPQAMRLRADGLISQMNSVEAQTNKELMGKLVEDYENLIRDVSDLERGIVRPAAPVPSGSSAPAPAPLNPKAKGLPADILEEYEAMSPEDRALFDAEMGW